MNTEQINTDALKATLNLLFGEHGTEMVQKTYVALDQAMQSAYWNGFDAGYGQAESDVEVLGSFSDDIEQELDEADAYEAAALLYDAGIPIA